MQSKNQYYFSGALMLMEPVTEREYNGRVYKERIIVIRNKYSQYGKWQINDATFHCTGRAVDALELMRIGLEVIAEFSINVVTWLPRGETEFKRWQKLSCNNIMSPSDKYKPETWWEDQPNTPSSKRKSKDEEEADKPLNKLSEEDFKQSNPENKKYDLNSKGVVIKGEPLPKLITKDAEPDEELPF